MGRRVLVRHNSDRSRCIIGGTHFLGSIALKDIVSICQYVMLNPIEASCIRRSIMVPTHLKKASAATLLEQPQQNSGKDQLFRDRMLEDKRRR